MRSRLRLAFAPAVFGALRDLRNNYAAALALAGALQCAAAALVLAAKPRRSRRRLRAPRKADDVDPFFPLAVAANALAGFPGPARAYRVPESPASHSIHATSSVAMALSFAAMRATSTSSKVWPVPSSTAVGAGCAGGAKAASTPLRRVIDVSGDGPNNTGRMVTLARDETTKRHFEAELHARRKLLIGNVADLLKLYGRGVPCRVGACEADHIRAEVRDRRVRHKGLDAIIMCGSARGKVPAIADAIERKPLWIDITPRKDVVDDSPDRRFVIGPEAHSRVETKKARLARALGEQHVPAALKGSGPCLKIEFFRRSVEAGQHNDRLTWSSIGGAGRMK